MATTALNWSRAKYLGEADVIKDRRIFETTLTFSTRFS